MKEYLSEGIVVEYKESNALPETLGMVRGQQYVIHTVKKDTTSSAPYVRVTLKTAEPDWKFVKHPRTNEIISLDSRHVSVIMDGPSDPKRILLPTRN